MVIATPLKYPNNVAAVDAVQPPAIKARGSELLDNSWQRTPQVGSW